MKPTVNDVHGDMMLSSISIAYMNSMADFVADLAFPIVPVSHQSDSYYLMDAAYMLRDDMQLRAAGGPYAMTDYGLSTATFSCKQWAIGAEIPDEVRANADSALNPEREKVELLAHRALIRRERLFAAAAMVTGVWGTDDNNSATDWDSTGTPITNVKTAKRTIKNATGRTGNVMVVGKIVYDALTTNSQITDLVKYDNRPALPLVNTAIATALDVEKLLVSDAVYESADEGEASSLLPIIDDDALIVHVPASPGLYMPSAGYTFVWNGGGGLGAISRVRDDLNDRDVVKIKMSVDQKVVATGCGYFFADIV